MKLLLVSRRNNLALEWAFSCSIGVRSWAEAKEKVKVQVKVKVKVKVQG